MATITEDYVDFEVAKLLKDKEFNIPLLTFYITDKERKESDFQIMAFTDDKIDNNYSDHCYLAPTLQMAMKWLREVHKFIPIVLTGGDSQNPFYYWFRIDRITKGKLEDAIYRENEKEFSSYEEACEAAIKHCLENLI